MATLAPPSGAERKMEEEVRAGTWKSRDFSGGNPGLGKEEEFFRDCLTVTPILAIPKKWSHLLLNHAVKLFGVDGMHKHELFFPPLLFMSRPRLTRDTRS